MLTCRFFKKKKKQSGRYAALHRRRSKVAIRRKKKFPPYLQVFFYKGKQTPYIFSLLFFPTTSNFSSRTSSLPSSSLISLFLSSRSTLSANSSLSAAQKWLCLADSADKRLNACCPQRRRRRGKVLEKNREGGDSKQRGGKWGEAEKEQE